MSAAPAEQDLAPERVAELMSVGEAQVVDVRTESEHSAGHLGAAAHIPFEQLPARAPELDPSRPVIFYCQSGSRSAAAAQAFAASGWEAYTIAGGLEQWAERGLPLEPDDGRVASMSGLPETPASN